MTLHRGSVVELVPARERSQRVSQSESAAAGIVWGFEGGDVLWIPVANARGDGSPLHRADIRVTDVGDHMAAGFSVPRPVIECRKLLRRPRAMLDGEVVLGEVPAALVARIAAMQVREAQALCSEIRLGAITSKAWPDAGFAAIGVAEEQRLASHREAA
jgi:hypothetical protein